jgi:hypothetical protein
MTLDSCVRPFEGCEDLGRNALYVGHALDGAGAVAKDGKEKLAALAEVVEPAAEGDGLAFMLAEVAMVAKCSFKAGAAECLG